MDFLGFSISSSLVSFTLSALVFLFGLQKSESQSRLNKVGFVFILLAVTSITGACLSLLMDYGAMPATAILLCTCVGWLTIVGHTFFKMRLMGAFTAPVCALILLVYYYSQANEQVITPGDSLFLFVHVLTATVGQSLAIAASAVSIFYLWQQRALKRKRLQDMSSDLPALDRLTSLLARFLWVGFAFLSVGLVTGAFYTSSFLTGENELSFKVIWAIAVWVWYFMILLGRNIFNFPDRRIAQLSVAGFLLIAITYFGVLATPAVGGVLLP